MKALIFITIIMATLSSNAQAQYYRYPYYRAVPRVYRPYAYRPVVYRNYWHRPAAVAYQQAVRYSAYQYYRNLISTGYTQSFYGNWFMVPTQFNNGYQVSNNYPYYAFNGYLHRYSAVDVCNYQLVNKFGHGVVQSFVNLRCDVGYNSCAVSRDRLNYQARNYQFFCAETFRQRI